MTPNLKWKLAAGALAVVAAAIGGVAISSAARGHSTITASNRPAFAGGMHGYGVGPGIPGGVDPDGHHGGPLGRGGGLDAAATYLGISTADLFAQLQGGKTLAQIANATSGKSASGLIAAMVAAEKQQLAAAVSSGRLTQSQADQITAQLQQRTTDMVDGSFRGPGFGRDRDGDHGFGPPPNGTAPNGTAPSGGQFKGTV